jgi:hypothetical protein
MAFSPLLPRRAACASTGAHTTTLHDTTSRLRAESEAAGWYAHAQWSGRAQRRRGAWCWARSGGKATPPSSRCASRQPPLSTRGES